MSRRARIAVLVACGIMLLAIGVMPFALMLLPHPAPLPSSSPGARGNGVYVSDGNGCFKLFPRATADDGFPADAFVARPDAAVFVKSRQYDYLSAYAVYAYPSGQPVDVSGAISSGILSLRPKGPLAIGRYVVKVSRDDAWGGSDYYFLDVTR